MSTSLRILAVSALLTANMALFTGPAGAASLDAPLPIAKAVHSPTHHVYRRGRDWRWADRRYGWRAPGELIAGVRGGGPLTVPFYGAGWYPGPVHYYSPRPVLCCRVGGDAVVSVRY
jgi:hypothetical protein